MKSDKSTLARLFWVTFVTVVSAGLFWLVFAELTTDRPEKLHLTSSGSVDMCLSCHTREKLDPAHDSSVLGCSPCHLGNPLAIGREEAHAGMVLNPGDLRQVEKTCASEGCHPLDGHKVKNSLMATNRGILGTLLYYWGESDSQDTAMTVEQLINSGESSLALDYFRKLCATCHLWKQKNDMDGVPKFFNEKGGGCSACHYELPGETIDNTLLVADDYHGGRDEGGGKVHPRVTAKVKSVNCVRCHNRSGRIGLSYMGIFESEGYGTPYSDGGQSDRQLPGQRFYLEIADDIHHEKGMECIDCHTRNEIMGDGTSYAHYEEQLEISCLACHGETGGVTDKGQVLTNFSTDAGEKQLTGKVDGKVRVVRGVKKGVCDFPAHKRVGCEACHSTWVAQCYGCHAKRDETQKHLDKLTGVETAGLWEEGRSYIRYEKPMLGVWNDQVVIVTPGCQDIVTVVGQDGRIENSFNRFTMAAINPHTTQAKGRECRDCHNSTKTVGLGEGTIRVAGGEMVFEGVDRGVWTSAGQTVPFDSYVNLDGVPQQHSSRPDLRPFNREELQKILQVGMCVSCHDSYLDPIWSTYNMNSTCKRTGDDETAGDGVSDTAEERTSE